MGSPNVCSRYTKHADDIEAYVTELRVMSYSAFQTHVNTFCKCGVFLYTYISIDTIHKMLCNIVTTLVYLGQYGQDTMGQLSHGIQFTCLCFL